MEIGRTGATQLHVCKDCPSYTIPNNIIANSISNNYKLSNCNAHLATTYSFAHAFPNVFTHFVSFQKALTFPDTRYADVPAHRASDHSSANTTANTNSH